MLRETAALQRLCFIMAVTLVLMYQGGGHPVSAEGKRTALIRMGHGQNYANTCVLDGIGLELDTADLGMKPDAAWRRSSSRLDFYCTPFWHVYGEQ
jgi:hypothetical protein